MKPPSKLGWYWTRIDGLYVWLPRWWDGVGWSAPADSSLSAAQASVIAAIKSAVKFKWKEIK